MNPMSKRAGTVGPRRLGPPYFKVDAVAPTNGNWLSACICM